MDVYVYIPGKGHVEIFDNTTNKFKWAPVEILQKMQASRRFATLDAGKIYASSRGYSEAFLWRNTFEKCEISLKI